MDNVLYAYISKASTLAIGEAGQFEIKSYTAFIDSSNDVIFPPAKTILYSPNPDKNIDAHFIDFVARQYQIPLEQATIKVKDYIRNICTGLNDGGTFLLAGLGRLNKSGNNIIFTANALKFYAPLPAKKIIRKNAIHSLRVGERDRSSSEMKDYFSQRPTRKNQWMYWVIGGLAITLIILAISAQ